MRHFAAAVSRSHAAGHLPCGENPAGTGFAGSKVTMGMIREAEANVRKQRFLLCRYALIFVTGAVGFLETAQGSPAPIAALVAVAMFSNLFLGTISAFSFFDATMQAPILVTDTAMVSAVLLVSRASQEFFMFFFFMLIMAAKIENLVALGVGAALIGFTSLLFTSHDAGLLSPLLMRVPFLLATALFYGYVVLPERTGQMTPLSRKDAPRMAIRVRAA